jgi:hypothetical protein
MGANVFLEVMLGCDFFVISFEKIKFNTQVDIKSVGKKISEKDGKRRIFMKNLSKNSKKTFNQIFSHKFNKNFLKALF